MIKKKMAKIALLAVFAFVCVLGFNPKVKAMTADEMRQLIISLQQQINTLLDQLNQMEQTQAPTSTQAPTQTTAWCHTFNTNLGVGSLGEEVLALHTALIKEGILPACSVSSLMNNECQTKTFGNSTASYIVRFQEKYAVEILGPWSLTRGNGYMGATTRAKLNRLYGCQEVVVQPVAPPTTQTPTTPTIPTTPTCSDTDGGKDYYTKGTMTSGGVSATDYCLTAAGVNKLNEYACDGSVAYDCPNGCEAGACKAAPATPTCTDTDGGKDYYTKGTMTSGGVSATDYCLTAAGVNKLNEYACDGSVAYDCPNGCEAGACKAAPATPTPLLYLKMDEASGQFVYDTSNTSRYGSLGASLSVDSDDPAWISSGCKNGSCLSFDGVNDTVIIDNIPVNTQAGGKNTVAFWMYWNGKESVQPFGWASLYALSFYGNTFGITTAALDTIGIANPGFLKNSWHHIVVVFPNDIPSISNSAMWIDGVKQTLIFSDHGFGYSPFSRTATNKMAISGWAYNAYYRFDGLIDEFRLYNTALTDEQAKAIYSSTLSAANLGQSAVVQSPTLQQAATELANIASAVEKLIQRIKEMFNR